MTTRREIKLNGQPLDEWRRAEARAEAERDANNASAIRGAVFALAIEASILVLVGAIFGLIVVAPLLVRLIR